MSASWWWCSAGSASPGPNPDLSRQLRQRLRLKSGQDVRIVSVPVGTVKDVKLLPDNSVDVTFDVNSRYQLYTSTLRAIVRCKTWWGRYLEITSAPANCVSCRPAARSPRRHQPAPISTHCSGGLRPVLKAWTATRSTGQQRRLELLQGWGGCRSCCPAPACSPVISAAPAKLIGDVITNLNTVLATVDARAHNSTQSVDQLQQLSPGWRTVRPIASAIRPPASAESDLTDMLVRAVDRSRCAGERTRC